MGLRNYLRVAALKRENDRLKERVRELEELCVRYLKDITNLVDKVAKAKCDASRREGECARELMKLAAAAKDRMVKSFGASASTPQLYKEDGVFYLKLLYLILEPRCVIRAFCRMLGITEADFFSNINVQWEEKIKIAKAEGAAVSFEDNFTDIGGKLQSRSETKQ